jgi:hypothetical protein
MPSHRTRSRVRRLALAPAFAAVLASAMAVPAQAEPGFSPPFHGPTFLRPGNLLVSTSFYDANHDIIVPGVTQLPPGCTGSNCVTAVADGQYPYVFNNAAVDASFGVTSEIMLDQLTPSGSFVNSLEVPNSSQPWARHGAQLVTSFSSKSELALNLSTDGRYVTFMGYVAPTGTVDVSNANTPGVIDSTNPVPGAYYRAVGQLDAAGRFQFTETNAYSGDNGRAAILNNGPGTGRDGLLYTAGNAGNGSNPQTPGIILGAGAQLMHPSDEPEAAQNPGTPTPVGSFNVTQLNDKGDKIGKDDNFRGLTVYNNVLYYTKGSGSNGVNTVYFVDTSGTTTSGGPAACPTGSGLPAAGATLPTTPLTYNASTLQTTGLPSNMCILKGFPTTLAKSTTAFPFGLWFANPDTVYVADEGDGTNTFSTASGTYTDAAGQTTAGLQKWVFDQATGNWELAYTLQNGLDLGQPYTVPGYPTGDNSGPSGTGLPWAPATDGLRNLTGRVNPNGTVTIWAVTSTVSGGGDQGADPNKLVAITDQVGATSLPSSEGFRTVLNARSGRVIRGVSFTPGTGGRGFEGDD